MHVVTGHVGNSTSEEQVLTTGKSSSQRCICSFTSNTKHQLDVRVGGGLGVSMQKRPGIKPRQSRHGGISLGLSIGKHVFLTSPSAQLTQGELRSLGLVIQLSSQCTLVLFLVTANLLCALTSRYGGCGVVFF